MTGTHSYFSQVEHDECPSATRSSLLTLDGTIQSLQPVSSLCVSEPGSNTCDLSPNPSLAGCTIDSNRNKTYFTRQQTRLLFRKIEELHNNQCEVVWGPESAHPDTQTLAAEAMMDVLRVAGNAFSDVFNFIPYVDKGIGEGLPRRQDEDSEQLDERFGRLFLNARMGVYTAKKIDRDGRSHKYALGWQDALVGIEESLVHPVRYIKLVSRETQDEIRRQLEYEWNEHASRLIRTEEALTSKAENTDGAE